MICYVLFVFSILVSLTGGGEGATTAYEPTDVFLFNCGSTSDNVEDNGRQWMAENPKFMPSNSVNASFSSAALYQQSQVPYMKARVFRSNFTYSFPVSPGWKFIRLYFYPTRYRLGFDTVNSFFTVTVNGFTLLKNFSADITVEASKTITESIIKEFIVPVYQTLNLTFTPSSNSLAFVNGIEIVSMPDRFYSKGGFDDKITSMPDRFYSKYGGFYDKITNVTDFHIDNSTAFETVHRYNVGGNMVDNVRDSGMFRRWLPDGESALGEIPGITVTVPGIKINYTEKTPAYVAPEDVYATARSMGIVKNNPRLNLNFSMTWFFAVDAGFSYLMRLHFCETLWEVNRTNQRVFSIFVGNQIAKTETDVIRLSGGSRNPVYIDFSMYVGFENGQKPDLKLYLHPLADSSPMYYDVILNGVEILKLNNSDGNLAGTNAYGDGLISGNIATIPETPAPEKGNKSHILVIILILVGSTVVLATFIVVLMLSIRQMKRKKKRKENSIVTFKVPLKQYTYAELKKITKSFSHTVGKGGFGTVYGGNLCNGPKVAVKVLKNLNGNGEDFINEVSSMSQTSHVNIVSLLGFCNEGSKRAIMYEFLENGSLDQFISRNNSLTQDVTTLYGIALGVARGIEYLHYGCKTRIVHFDIKPQNILLDGNLCPKVSDFGLAKLCEKRESIVSLMDTRGTIGYIAPEVVSRMYGRISYKSDVYSYGMLVLEMIGARNKEIVETTTPNASSSYFPDWIYKGLENGEQTWRFGDEITEVENEIGKKMVVVSLWCIQPCPSNRPPMNRVVEMMEGNLDALEVPPKPSMHISTEIIPESSSLSDGGEAE